MCLGRLKFFCALIGAGVALSLFAPVSMAKAQKPVPLMDRPQAVHDLFYGDALFYFYQDDYLQALTRLQAARSMERIAEHEVETELLIGALYLSLGQHVEAGKIFTALLQEENVAPAVRNRTWFYLAKLWYQRNYFAEAETALKSIQGVLPAEFEPERQMLLAQVLMSENRFDEAITVLQRFWGDAQQNDWSVYARFNLGVALVRQERIAEGAQLLEAVGRIAAATPDLVALRDKANLSLGFAWLHEGKAEDARRVLSRVRLQGPYSDKALLGLGWAAAAQQEYTKALVPWLALAERPPLGAAVQEAYLAVPYAYAQLSAEAQAAEHYATAIRSFHEESARIDESIATIRKGEWLTNLLQQEAGTQMGWYWQLTHVPDAPETRYLYPLLASHVFQEALKNYRDLALMQHNLDTWKQSLVAFESMIDTRRIAYQKRSAVLQQVVDHVDLAGLEAAVSELAARVEAVERTNDVTALATPHEQALWLKVQRIENVLATMDNDAVTAELKDRTRIVRGALYWNMNAHFKASLWHEKKTLRELEVASKESRQRWNLLAQAREDSPKTTLDFAARVVASEQHLTQSLQQCQSMIAAQSEYLSRLAVAELEAQQRRLTQYILQAQFALAVIYDRAASRPATQSQPAAEVQP